MMRLQDKFGWKKTNMLWAAAVMVAVTLVLFACVFNRTKETDAPRGRTFQHEENADADPFVGQTEIRADGTVDPETFATHLPLVVIDTGGREISDIYAKGDNESRLYADPKVTDPWTGLSIQIIDNDSHVNRLTDEPYFSSQGKIKLRGNSSRSFAKKQYGIKLLDEAGEELEAPLLGMEADEDWILCNSILDASYIRSYLAYNIGGLLMPCTPEARFCELIRKDGDTCEYLGLYLLLESVKRGPGRVDIDAYTGNTSDLSYIVDRDRYDYTSTMLSTYASDRQLCYGWFKLIYPKNRLADEKTTAAIGAELSAAEQALYSDDPKVFRTYTKYIDVDSFVDYFIFNEFMANYDAGTHSTYYYRDKSHKLTMGPFWDYDGCLDNYRKETAGLDWMVFPTHPWFERLVRDPAFTERLCTRYHALRKTILSDAFIETFVDGTVAYLGNAAAREHSRWGRTYDELYTMLEGRIDGFIIDRSRNTHEEEIERLLDTQQMHAAWMDANIETFLSAYVSEELDDGGRKWLSFLVVAILAVFVVLVYLVSKLSRGETGERPF